MLNMEKAHVVDHLVVNDYKVKLIYGYILHTPYSMNLPKMEVGMCSQHIVYTTVRTREGQADHLHGPNINLQN